MATPAATAQQPTPTPSPPSDATPHPLFELYIDVPHPAASKNCPPEYIIEPPQLDNNPTLGTKELQSSNSIARLSRFAFPSFDDRHHAQELARRPNLADAKYNRLDVYAYEKSIYGKDSVSACPGSMHTFVMQLKDQTKIYGHVRRYQSVHENAKNRFDVGRRGVRSLVILTRCHGGEKFFYSILKTLESIIYECTSLPATYHPTTNPAKDFLHALFTHHRQMSKQYLIDEQQNKVTPPNDQNPTPPANHFLTISGIEFGGKAKHHLPVDLIRFILPPSILNPQFGEVEAFSGASSSQLLPLLRCLGAVNTIRLMTALMMEKRIVLTSKSSERLSGCIRGACSILAQGCLKWHGVYVPIMPPGMINYLAAPVKYLVGVVSPSGRAVVERVKNIGELLVVDLDTKQLQIYGVPSPTSRIPDLMRSNLLVGVEELQMTLSNAEMLLKDLEECIRNDKRATSARSDAQAVISGASAAAAKTINASVAAANKAKGWLKKKYLKRGDVPSADELLVAGSPVVGQSAHNMSGGDFDDNGPIPENSSEDKYSLGEGFVNEAGEEEARVSFTGFFMAITGDMRWYLTQRTQGATPELDKQKFIASRKREGDVEGTPMLTLLAGFAETQIFEKFVTAVVADVQRREPVSKDAPLYKHCAHYHRTHRIDFSPASTRRVARQISLSDSPSRSAIQLNLDVRRMAMTVTSTNRIDGTVVQLMSKITDMCRDCTSALLDVIAVIWQRILDSQGSQWRHGLYALQLLRELLLHGPVATVAEATDGLEYIRDLKSFKGTRYTNVNDQLKMHATHVYSMLVDRPKLFSQRRRAAERRRSIRSNSPIILKDERLRLSLPFNTIHAMARDAIPIAPAVPSFAAATPPVPVASSAAAAAAAAAPVAAPAPVDLLNFDYAATPQAAPPSTSAAGGTAVPVADEASSVLLDIFSVAIPSAGDTKAPPAGAAAAAAAASAGGVIIPAGGAAAPAPAGFVAPSPAPAPTSISDIFGVGAPAATSPTPAALPAPVPAPAPQVQAVTNSLQQMNVGGASSAPATTPGSFARTSPGKAFDPRSAPPLGGSFRATDYASKEKMGLAPPATKTTTTAPGGEQKQQHQQQQSLVPLPSAQPTAAPMNTQHPQMHNQAYGYLPQQQQPSTMVVAPQYQQQGQHPQYAQHQSTLVPATAYGQVSAQQQQQEQHARPAVQQQYQQPNPPVQRNVFDPFA